MKRIPKIKVKKKKKKKGKIVKQGTYFIDETRGSMHGKHHRDLPDDVFGDAMKFFKG